MTIKYNHIFHSKALQNLPKFEFLVWNQTIWQPCPRPAVLKLKTFLFLEKWNISSFGEAYQFPARSIDVYGDVVGEEGGKVLAVAPEAIAVTHVPRDQLRPVRRDPWNGIMDKI
jgi:hypothetical protein